MAEGGGAETEPLAETRRFSPGFFPYGFRKEARELFRLAWPLSLSILFHYMMQPISLAFCGHLGSKQLASVALALSVIYITTISFGRGLAFGGDTFFSQSYGSPNKKMMGVYLQRGLIFGVLTSFPIWALLLNTETLLLLVGQDPTVSRMAQEYVLLFMPGVLAYCWLFLLMRYLLCQNRVIPNFIICVIACGINALLHYGLLYQADMGIKGSAIALAISYYMVLFMFVAYIWGSGIYKETWGGWTWECLEEWGAFGRVAVASIAMTFIFWLCTEVGTFLAGILGEKEISAFSIMFQVEGFAWMIPLGLGGACTARVGQFLGSNEPLGALTSTRVSLVITVFISVALAGSSFALKSLIPRMFTNSNDVADYTAALFPILSVFLLLEGFGGVCVGIVRGTGRQTIGAVVIFISYYVFALPVGVPLMFLTFLGLGGLWWGYVLGIGLQDIALMAFVFKMNWNEEAHKAQIRAGVANIHIQVEKPESQQEDEVNERSSLLHRGNIQATDSNSNNYVEIGGPSSRSLAALVFKRLGILLIFVAILVGGVLCRIFVHITPNEKWSELCIPVRNESLLTTTEEPAAFHLSTTTLQPENFTLPYCNFTEPNPERYGLWLGFGP